MTTRTFLAHLACLAMALFSDATGMDACTIRLGHRCAVVNTPVASFYVHNGALVIKEQSGTIYTSCPARFPAYSQSALHEFSSRNDIRLHAIRGTDALHFYALAIHDNNVFAIDKQTGTILLLTPTGYSVLWSPTGLTANGAVVYQSDSTFILYDIGRVIRYHIGRRECIQDIRLRMMGIARNSMFSVSFRNDSMSLSFSSEAGQTEKTLDLNHLPTQGLYVVTPAAQSTSAAEVVTATTKRPIGFVPSHRFHVKENNALSLLHRDVSPEITWGCFMCSVRKGPSTKTEFYDMVADSHGNVFISSSKGIYVVPAVYTKDAQNAIRATHVLENVVVYPNPASTYITFDVDGTNLIQPQATIVSLNGHAYANKPIEGERTTFDVSMLPTGTYGLVLSTTNAKVFRTLVISR